MARHQRFDSDRRKLLNAGLYFIGTIAVGGYLAYDSIRSPDFREAYENEKLRHKWADGLETRKYARIMIATPAVLEELKNSKNYTPPKGAFAATFPVDESRIGSGSRSIVYVFPECFAPAYKEHISDIGIIIENVIENHELVHANHYYQGIPGFPLSLFQRKDSTLDNNLFTIASEIIAHKSEFLGLQNAKSGFVAKYRDGLRALANNHLCTLHSLTNDRSLIERLELEARF
ncbi:MAG: hypothetical protein QXT19_03560 [Candidatus Woesearchaeota archaeon]